MSELRYEVLVNDGLRRHREQRLPDGSPIISSPVASTLIYGDRDAVLVDPPFTYEQVKRVGDWIEAFGKHLTAVYATHGHGDHWFGTELLLQRFPDAVAYATTGTIAMMHQQGTVGRAELWDVDFPGLIPPSPVNYRTMPADGIELEGHRLLAVEVGHTDTDDTTVLHVPSIGLVVAGDVVYNGVHQYLLESAGGGIDAWLVALDKVAALQPSAVVAGHKNKGLPDDPATIEQTRDYLLNARRLLAEKRSPREYFDAMVALYPDRLNVGPVWYTAVVLLPEQTTEEEVANWFFADYLATWIGVGAGRVARGPEFILDYWSAPLNWSDDEGSRWFLDKPSVVALLDALQTRLRAEDYRDTAVPDFRVSAYHANGAAVEVIWSRRRTDGSEIERLAAHFEVVRGPEGWRIISIQAKPTSSDSLNAVWPQAN
ncbi:Zn-dependent hydrolase, glyoxylase [Mycobacterium sp. JS623]|uniref:MBL fold metallo-hydrolase n=1 Tax=Mycobacterium sp. JS623 TaxID=212767 RepID=UPI0002A54DFB|nr:MBL fold metallo-hydrolase [Mycobacterium sp. JS623]AGB22055.1 Zn-dependent hydrolase, glyoxylase [Mycobacterium sp. JS623]